MAPVPSSLVNNPILMRGPCLYPTCPHVVLPHTPCAAPTLCPDCPHRSLAEIQPSAQAVQTSEIELQEVDGTEGSRSGKQAQPIVSSHPSETSDMPFNVLRYGPCVPTRVAR